MTQHTGDTINKLTEAVERAEQRANDDREQAERYRQSIAGNPDYCMWPTYSAKAFPEVEDESDLQSMLDGLMSEHERGN